MAKVYQLVEGNGYAPRTMIGGINPSTRGSWMGTTTIAPLTRQEMAKALREHRAAGLAVTVIGETPLAKGLRYQTDTREPWTQLRGYPTEETLHLNSGSYRIEYVRG